MPAADIINPAGAFGQEANAPNQGALTAPFTSAEATVTINRGQVVSINTAGKILRATTSVDVDLVIGIAVENIAPGGTGLVALYGLVTNVAAQGAIAAGALVARSATTAGSVADAAVAADGVIGVAVAAAASNLVNIFVFKA